MSSHQCTFCGSRTGQHGFAFGTDGKYHSEEPEAEKPEPTFSIKETVIVSQPLKTRYGF